MMRLGLLFFLLLSQFIQAQDIYSCKQRFDQFLNFRNSLNANVRFDGSGIELLDDQGHLEIKIYPNEISTLAFFFENSTVSQQEFLIKLKGTKQFTQRQLDSIYIFADDWKSISNHLSNKFLQGYRIAIDPGHFGITMAEADVEQKYLYFVKDSVLQPLDSIKLFESALTFNTAVLVKMMLEEQGAEVMLTRVQNNYTSFNCTYSHWIKHHKKRTIDSLHHHHLITQAKHKELHRLPEKKFFWDFFRDFDLNNRVNKMNAFHPHLSLIIHYNVDEKNEPWKQFTKEDFTMAFIGGVFTEESLQKKESKYHFLRLLLSDQLNRSQQLAGETVQQFHTQLQIPIATQNDATYLKESCLSSAVEGVFSRNLMLCRKINSPLVYGESLYQDNQKEAEALMKMDVDYKGMLTNERLLKVATAYYEALINFVKRENE